MKAGILLYFLISMNVSFSQETAKDALRELAFQSYIKDSILIDVYLLHDDQGRPDKYYSRVWTPVCEDSLCYTIDIDIYWDLLGNFAKYVLPTDDPLTKFDHQPFTKEDYIQLDEILSDRSSILRYCKVEDLIDRSDKIQSKVTDAVTGATRKSFEGLVVSGAVYSSYTLWHIVNGIAAESMIRLTESSMNDSLLVRLLASDNLHYQYYALNKLSDPLQIHYAPYLIRLIGEGNDYVPYFAMDKLSKVIWETEQYQEALIQQFGRINFELQNELLTNLKTVRMSRKTISLLANFLDTMTMHQKMTALLIFRDNQDTMTCETLSKITPMLENGDNALAETAFEVLQNHGGNCRIVRNALTKYKRMLEKS